uniref:RNA-directed DNA polymerase n=1 Tax=Marmota marmota marmota TaxID=9994 RepID=A0A8C6ADV2_MARMA
MKREPIPKAQTVYTDGAKNGFAVVFDGSQILRQPVSGQSAQKAEVEALIIALKVYSSIPLNVYTDSLYVANLALVIETASYIGKQSTITEQLQVVQLLIWARRDPLYIGHIRSHSGLPGPLSEGNAKADAATHAVGLSCVTTEYDKALQFHNKFHLNAQSLRFHTGCSRDQALQIVSLCPTCAPFIHSPSLGVNPRGLQPNDVWQTDVTHFPSFGKLSFIHVSTDTYSGFIFATLHTGEKAKDVISHLLKAFSSMGTPRCLKTDNGPAYVSQAVQRFCTQWEINHKTGIPYNPQGQAIVERAHQHLKTYLQKTKEGEIYRNCQGPQALLSITLFTLNFLLTDTGGRTAAQRHFSPPTVQDAQIRWKDLSTGKWQPPAPLLARVRGAVCVFPPGTEKPIWIPERCTRPVNENSRQNEVPKMADPATVVLTPSSECRDTPHELDPACGIPSGQVC